MPKYAISKPFQITFKNYSEETIQRASNKHILMLLISLLMLDFVSTCALVRRIFDAEFSITDYLFEFEWFMSNYRL